MLSPTLSSQSERMEHWIGGSGAGGGGDPSHTEGELVEGPSLEEA